MADKKISARTRATTPLAGTEVLPIVQGGATKQVSVANLTAGRAISATQLTLTTGNLIVANGQGVDFSATPGAGTSELFADYEEGTWTPSVGGTATYTAQTGYYTKIGNFVKLRFLLTINVLGTGSTTNITGIPYNPSGNQPVIVGGVVCYANNLATPALALGVYAQSDGTLKFFSRNSSLTTATNQAVAVIGNGFDVYAEVSYQV
jgi:hypothetical protein